jgi:tRNA1Val (adenine37-N6)-methyltransferase
MKVTTDACLFGAWTANEVRCMKQEVCNVLDIGTGTGLLGLMLAQQSNATIHTIEADKEAFEQAVENIAASPWSDGIKIFCGDAREYDFPIQYDLIISNPPFYEKELKSGDTKRNIALHNEGLLLDELLHIIKKNLKPDGRFYLLSPHKRNNELDNLFAQQKLAINHKVFIRQSTKHDYFRIMISGTHQIDKTGFSTSEISIWSDKQQYTEEFIALLKDYYLYL